MCFFLNDDVINCFKKVRREFVGGTKQRSGNCCERIGRLLGFGFGRGKKPGWGAGVPAASFVRGEHLEAAVPPRVGHHQLRGEESDRTGDGGGNRVNGDGGYVGFLKMFYLDCEIFENQEFMLEKISNKIS